MTRRGWSSPGHDRNVRAVRLSVSSPPESPMHRFVAPLGFSLAAVWVALNFLLVTAAR
ncbi:MAG TPA: hypothetical protein VES42_17075 [Pilimelia sp.]|nr:hypothetical protein [Pilimelia sp.]